MLDAATDNLFEREQRPRALGGGQILVADDVLGLQIVAGNKTFDEIARGGNLTLGRAMLREVADQADADPVFVVFAAGSVGSVQLIVPAKRRFDKSIGHPLAVADHEMIPDAQPRLAATVGTSAMVFVDRLDVTRFRRRVMQYDIAPGTRSFTRLEDAERGRFSRDSSASERDV